MALQHGAVHWWRHIAAYVNTNTSRSQCPNHDDNRKKYSFASMHIRLYMSMHLSIRMPIHSMRNYAHESTHMSMPSSIRCLYDGCHRGWIPLTSSSKSRSSFIPNRSSAFSCANSIYSKMCRLIYFGCVYGFLDILVEGFGTRIQFWSFKKLWASP